jgi:hypothetical protein
MIGTDLGKAIELLNQGKLVAIPTETVYGLAANALDAEAVLSIFTAKKRPTFDPLIVHVASIEAAQYHVADFNEKAWAPHFGVAKEKSHSRPCKFGLRHCSHKNAPSSSCIRITEQTQLSFGGTQCQPIWLC